MTVTSQDEHSTSQAELLGAALRYCVVADWFESHPCAWQRHMPLSEAMGFFNRAESELRQIAAKLARRSGHRHLLLQAAGVPREAW